jgi:hypothetical protein
MDHNVRSRGLRRQKKRSLLFVNEHFLPGATKVTGFIMQTLIFVNQGNSRNKKDGIFTLALFPESTQIIMF